MPYGGVMPAIAFPAILERSAPILRSLPYNLTLKKKCAQNAL